jgi:hypothetical protein
MTHTLCTFPLKTITAITVKNQNKVTKSINIRYSLFAFLSSQYTTFLYSGHIYRVR